MVEKTAYLEERPGVKSNMRLMSIVSLFASILFALITLSGRAGDTNTGDTDFIKLNLTLKEI